MTLPQWINAAFVVALTCLFFFSLRVGRRVPEARTEMAFVAISAFIAAAFCVVSVVGGFR